jgi:hypothetical protein
MINEFKKELKALLKKYDACLNVNVDGDTHGLLYDFEVELSNKTYILKAGNNYLDASDIKED